MALARRGFLAAVSAALLAPFAKPPDSEEFYAKVGPIDRTLQESKLTLAIMPSAVSVGISGDLSELLEGDMVRFHIEKSEVVWRGRHIHVRNVELTP